jgi:hypothetical protein
MVLRAVNFSPGDETLCSYFFKLNAVGFRLATLGFKLATLGFKLAMLGFKLATLTFKLAAPGFNSCYAGLLLVTASALETVSSPGKTSNNDE